MRSKTLGINVRVTPEEKAKLLKNASYCALSLSEYLRRLGLGKDVEATVREKEYRVFRKLKQLSLKRVKSLAESTRFCRNCDRANWAALA